MSACSGSHGGSVGTTGKSTLQGLRFVRARSLAADCRTTARAVGYRVPCPRLIPQGLLASENLAGSCSLHIIGPGGVGGCSKTWRGWVVSSSETGDQHLVITASPVALRNDAKLVNGPTWYPAARVRPLGTLTINGWHIRAVYVPPATNAGSVFAHHVVLIWTDRGHTYGVGFHNVEGIQKTLTLDEALVRHMTLVGP